MIKDTNECSPSEKIGM